MNQIARTPKQIGSALRRQRRKLGLSQTTLGEKTKLRQATISTVEDGEPGAQLQTLCAMMNALDLEFVIRARTKGAAEDIEDIF
jgi:HTH-type transcriptional regulator/antitoxin HipB